MSVAICSVENGNPGDMLSQRPSGVFVNKTSTGALKLKSESTEQERRVAVSLSSERLAPYLRAVKGDLSRALSLYEWNLAASGPLYEALGVVEVVLRNALAEQLSVNYSSHTRPWYEDPAGVFSWQAHADIEAARNRVQKLGRSETQGRVISELNFGFWKFLLAKRYEATLWTKCLRHAFPNLQPQSRSIAYEAVGNLHAVRNRIAHHEPIHRRNLFADMLTIYRVLEWIDSDVRFWATEISRLKETLGERPAF